VICKGNLHSNGVKLIDYILCGAHGESVEFAGARGFDFFGSDLRAAAAVMQRLAVETTRCENPWFHTQTRLAPGEKLDLAQWEQTLDREEKRLGFSGLPRAWSFHVDEATGDMHMHAAWFRIDMETGLARDPGLFKHRLMEVARTCEVEFGLREVSNARQAHDRARSASRKEEEEARRLGVDGRGVRTAILDCLEQADSGRAFRAALEEHGLVLANGDKRDCFVVVDEAAGIHALNKRLTGITLAAMRERLADLDRAQLPSVAEAKAMQRERQNAREERAGSNLSVAPQTAIDQTSAAAPMHGAEPPIPNWDRDAADRAWLERVENAGIAHAIEQSSGQPAISMTLSDIKVPAGEQPVTPARAFTPEPEQGLRNAWSLGDHLLGGVTQVLTALADFAANMIAPAPPPTRDQAIRAAVVAEEKQDARAEQLVQQEKLSTQDWLIDELKRQQQAREREDEEHQVRERRRSHSL
jgi:hypothetical protein